MSYDSRDNAFRVFSRDLAQYYIDVAKDLGVTRASLNNMFITMDYIRQNKSDNFSGAIFNGGRNKTKMI